MAMQPSHARWAIVVSTIALGTIFVILEGYWYLRHGIRVSGYMFTAHDFLFGPNTNTASEELDDLPSRLTRIASVCKKYEAHLRESKTDSRASWRHPYCDRETCSFHLVEKHRFGFCPIPKAATSSLKTLILAAEHIKDPGDDPDDIFNAFKARFPSVAPSTYWAEELGSQYTKLIVVRHPFGRLVSAYVDKILTTHPSIPGAKAMYKRGFVGKGPSGTFTFAEFVNNILKLPLKDWDPHWAPFTPRCRPCSMRYDVIVKVETLDQDLEALLPRMGLAAWSFPKRNVKARRKDTRRQTAAEYFSELSRQQVLQLYAIYMYDFELFGYKLEGFTDPVL